MYKLKRECQQLFKKEFVHEMNKFLKNNSAQLIQEVKSLNIKLTIKETEVVAKVFPQRKHQP